LDIEAALKGVGVGWVRTRCAPTSVAEHARHAAGGADHRGEGLKVLIAESECQLERSAASSRLVRRLIARRARGAQKFGVDDDVCTGDHSCIRLSGCPSLTIKTNPIRCAPTRWPPCNEGCVGCGLCGDVAHAAMLCPSFYKARIVSNPTGWDRLLRARAGGRHRLAACAASGATGAEAYSFMSAPIRPRNNAIKIVLVLAMGGEGGGVLADWIDRHAATANGWYAQTTSVPGVAQRTGATIYYVELFPEAAARADGGQPVLALMPLPGDVDLVLASELMEAGRAVQRGLVTPDRTTLDRLDAPRLFDRREERDGRRPRTTAGA
jgi:hypothetical protein